MITFVIEMPSLNNINKISKNKVLKLGSFMQFGNLIFMENLLPLILCVSDCKSKTRLCIFRERGISNKDLSCRSAGRSLPLLSLR